MMGKNNPKRPMIIYYIIGVIVLLLLNSYVLPKFLEPGIEEVSYSEFLKDMKAGKVEKVVLGQDIIKYQHKDKKEENKTFITGNISSENLLEDLKKNNIENYSKERPNSYSLILSFILTWLLPFAFIFFMGRYIMNSLAKKSGDMMQFGKANAKIYVQSKTGKKFDDVAGQEEAKESLREIVDFLHEPEKYTKIGASLPKGLLFVGPPGTGKTLMAQAVAGEANVPFFSMSGSEFVQMFVGLGATKVRDLFKQAVEKAPCIVFIDEIDAIGKRRDSSGIGGNDEREQTLNQLLTEMDGFDGKEGVVILGATNRPEILDPALTRPGRFDREVQMELPDLKGREEILKVHAKKIKISEDIDYNKIALSTAGSSGAQLANIVNEAALRAVKFGRDMVIQEDLEESVEVVIAGQIKKGAVISPREKELIAYHEVGHALVAASQTNSAPVTKITIIPRTSGALGYTMQVEQEEKFLMSKEDIINKITTLTGGRAAEELVFGVKTTGASNDIEVSTRYARAMITQYGMTDEFGMTQLETSRGRYLDQGADLIVSAQTQTKIDELVSKTIKDAQDKATNILKENIDKLHEIAKFLIEKETITGDEFMAILKGQENNEVLEENISNFDNNPENSEEI